MSKIIKLSDKLTKIGECLNVYFYDNAFMVEVTGRNSSDDWSTVKLMCKDLSEVCALLQEADSLPRDY